MTNISALTLTLYLDPNLTVGPYLDVVDGEYGRGALVYPLVEADLYPELGEGPDLVLHLAPPGPIQTQGMEKGSNRSRGKDLNT